MRANEYPPPRPKFRYRARPELLDALNRQGRTRAWLVRVLGVGSRQNAWQITTGRRNASEEQSLNLASALRVERDAIFERV